MEYEGIIYRPPSEARSLILQVTVGCAHNTCTFCNMYRQKNFRIRPLPDILGDIRELEAGGYGPYIRRVFLADGDALAMGTEELLSVLREIRRCFPAAGRVSAYARADDVLRKTPEELLLLREAGLTLFYLGAESGDDGILEAIHKGVSSADLIAAAQRMRGVGIGSSVTLISGLGGQEKMEIHAKASAKLITAMRPEYAAFLTLRLYEGTPMYEDAASGRFRRITPDQIMDEMEIFLTHVDSPGTVFRSNHASNYLALAGTLNGDIPKMLAQVRRARDGHRYRRFRETGDLL